MMKRLNVKCRVQVLHYSALHAAAALEKDEITKVLVQAGANVNATTKVHTNHLPPVRRSLILIWWWLSIAVLRIASLRSTWLLGTANLLWPRRSCDTVLR